MIEIIILGEYKMNYDLLIHCLLSIFLATSSGFSVATITNNGCTDSTIEMKSFLIAAICGFLFSILYNTVDLMLIENSGELYFELVLPLISVFLGCLGGLIGHAWHENWEKNNSSRSRPFDMGMLDCSPQQIKKTQDNGEFK